MFERLLKRPPIGTVTVKMPWGTMTIHDAKWESIHASNQADGWKPYRAEVFVGNRVTHRRNFKSWLKGALKRAERRENGSHATRGVTRTRYYRHGLVGAETTVQFDSQGQDFWWTLRVDMPGLSVGVTVSRWFCRPGHVEFDLPDFTFDVEGFNRQLKVDPLHIWNYPWGSRREWGISILRVNGASMFLYANGEEEGDPPRLDVLWRHIKLGGHHGK